MKIFLFICFFILNSNVSSAAEKTELVAVKITVSEGDSVILNKLVHTLFDVESIVSLENEFGYPVDKGIPLENYASFFVNRDTGLSYALLDTNCMEVGKLLLSDKETEVLMCDKVKKIKLEVINFSK
jgi:hypothetical protein